MIDIVIPLGTAREQKIHNATLQDHGELRYCLRGIEKYLTGWRQVVIIGEVPSWIKRSEHLRCIPAEDIKSIQHKERNIFNKLLIAATHQVTGSFLFMNDDHYLLQPYHAPDFPNYYNGTVATEIAKQKVHGAYDQTLRNTREAIGPNALYFDIHAPIVYKHDLVQAMTRLPWPDYGYAIKSMYGFLAPIRNAVPMEDLKVGAVMTEERTREVLAERAWFSCSDYAYGNSLQKVMAELYPDKSRFEL